MAKQVVRWVCHACKGVWFQPTPNGRCPSCNGTGEERKVEMRDDGSIKVD